MGFTASGPLVIHSRAETCDCDWMPRSRGSHRQSRQRQPKRTFPPARQKWPGPGYYVGTVDAEVEVAAVVVVAAAGRWGWTAMRTAALAGAAERLATARRGAGRGGARGATASEKGKVCEVTALELRPDGSTASSLLAAQPDRRPCTA